MEIINAVMGNFVNSPCSNHKMKGQMFFIIKVHGFVEYSLNGWDSFHYHKDRKKIKNFWILIITQIAKNFIKRVINCFKNN